MTAAHTLLAFDDSYARDVPGVAYVSAEGLEDRGDQLHFSAASARELGRRYAAAYLGLLRR